MVVVKPLDDGTFYFFVGDKIDLPLVFNHTKYTITLPEGIQQQDTVIVTLDHASKKGVYVKHFPEMYGGSKRMKRTKQVKRAKQTKRTP